MSIKLPLTGIPIHFSTARYYPNKLDSTNCRGIIPEFKGTIQNSSNHDADINFLLGLLEKI